jgi:2-keto-3-deoxy-L-rhamnonate aldolase RhmA
MTIAPFDLSTELGVSGQMDAPELVEAITYAEQVIRDAGIPLGHCRGERCGRRRRLAVLLRRH